MTQAPQGQTQVQVDPGISGFVSKFDDNPKHFQEWVKSIDKYAVFVSADDDRKT